MLDDFLFGTKKRHRLGSDVIAEQKFLQLNVPLVAYSHFFCAGASLTRLLLVMVVIFCLTTVSLALIVLVTALLSSE